MFSQELKTIDVAQARTRHKLYPDRFLINCQSLRSIDLAALSDSIEIPSSFLAKQGAIDIDFGPFEHVYTIEYNFLESTKMKTVNLGSMTSLETIRGSFILNSRCVEEVNLYGCIGLRAIGANFLGDCRSLRHVSFPPVSRILTIENFFMFNCGHLRHIDLTCFANVRWIGDWFLSGSGLEYIDLSPLANVEKIGERFLSHTDNLDEIDIRPMVKLRSIGFGSLISTGSMRQPRIRLTLEQAIRLRLPFKEMPLTFIIC